MDALAVLYFAKIYGLYVRTIGICGYGWQISYPRQVCKKVDTKQKAEHGRKKNILKKQRLLYVKEPSKDL